MHYVSTRRTVTGRGTGAGRDAGSSLNFADVLLAGLADDGGLYVPAVWPQLPPLGELATLSYHELAVEVMWPFVVNDADGPPQEISRSDFEKIVGEAYSEFDSPEVCPVRRVGDLWMMELFHGPTLAFKDVALQLVGRLFDHVLNVRGGTVTILGATSGDTGSAAMSAFEGLDRAECVILFPDGRTSEVQRRQMTTIEASNCHAVAVAGTFDDCQDLVKAAFGDSEFRDEVRLSAVNSINWGRVMAQIVYYVWAQLKVSPDGSPVSFCVPTGNFGNVLAGWAAKQMGLPVDRLIVASNRNDILARAISQGDMSMREVIPTTSPSMDIQVSSNFERLLFELLGRDGQRTSELLSQFRSDGRLALSPEVLEALQADFEADRLDDDKVSEVIDAVHEEHDLLVDPHTAVGLGVAQAMLSGSRRDGSSVPAITSPIVCLATAHPAKFPDAVFDATGVRPVLPERLAGIFDRPERVEHVDSDLGAVEDLVRRVLAVRP